MQQKRIHEDGKGLATFVLVLDEGDEAIAGLEAFSRQHDLSAAEFTAIGAFQEATLGFFDVGKRIYEEIRVDEQTEVLTLAGNITLHSGEVKVHAHVVLGKRNGQALGGHLLKGRVRPTLEIMITETPADLERVIDEKTGLPLLRI